MRDLVEGDSNQTLLPVIRLNYPEIAYDLWVLWRACDRRFLPSEIMQEPIKLLDDMLQLDGIYQNVKGLADGNNN